MCKVAPEEQLARYVLQKSLFRPSDNTVKPQAFMPHPREELSVTRHQGLADEEIWQIGQNVAEQRGTNFYGRADCKTEVFTKETLTVVAAPIEGNQNHANVTNWPIGKPQQKIIAMKIAQASSFKTSPLNTN